MGQYVMTAESAVRVLTVLDQHGVHACVGGGWSVDALLQEQTRAHSDLDLWLAAPDVEPLFVAVAELRIDRILPWPGDRPWNFVLHDGRQLRIDLHFYERMTPRLLHYGAFTGAETFPEAALSGAGRIGGMPVRCEAPDWVVRWHSGYPPRLVDRQDVARVCERFGVPIPESYQ